MLVGMSNENYQNEIEREHAELNVQVCQRNGKQDHKHQEKVLRWARRQIRALFYWQTLGLVLCLSALLAVQMLQTSINIEGQVGSISVTAGFVTSLFVCLFICPTVLKTLGPTMSLILSEVCYLIYCACNFYPELYILVPGGIFSGIGRALYVPSYSLLIITLTSHCSKYALHRGEEHYFNQLQSRFYSLNEFVQIIGNGLSYAILYSTYRPQEILEHSPDLNNLTSYANYSSMYQYCGANDCQDTDVVKQNIFQYVPPEKSSIYIFLSSTVILAISGIIVHCTIFPGVGTFSHKLSKIERRFKQKLADCPSPISASSHDSVSVPSSESGELKPIVNTLNGTTDESLDDRVDQENAHNRGDASLLGGNQKVESLSRKKLEDDYWSTLKKTLIFMVRPRAILIGTAALHSGMQIGFCFADLTRAYASCVAGVQMTGAFAACFGIAGMISSYLYGKLLPLCGRMSIYTLATILELLVYGVCYFWVPDPNSIYVIFLIFIGTGFVNGIVRQNVIAAYTIHFPNEKGMALTAFNVAYTGGIGVQYGLSTFMCVSSKIFTQAAVTSAGLIFYGIAEILHARNSSLMERCRKPPLPE